MFLARFLISLESSFTYLSNLQKKTFERNALSTKLHFEQMINIELHFNSFITFTHNDRGFLHTPISILLITPISYRFRAMRMKLRNGLLASLMARKLFEIGYRKVQVSGIGEYTIHHAPHASMV